MSKVTTKYYQKCEFCHKEYEVPVRGMQSISLPGYYIEDYGSKSPSFVTGTICPDCVQKIREKLSEFVKLNEVAYGGNNFEWIEKENKDARN